MILKHLGRNKAGNFKKLDLPLQKEPTLGLNVKERPNSVLV